MLPEEESAFRFHKELLAMLAIVALPGRFYVFPAFNNVFSFFPTIIVTGRVLTDDIDTSTRSGHRDHKKVIRRDPI